MSFDANEVHAAVYVIFKKLDYREPPFSTSKITRELFPELDVHGASIDQFAKIEVFDAPLPSGKRAIITYDEKAAHPTQRFSIAHELGHWMFDYKRGTEKPTILCARRGGKPIPERRADYAAAELLVPMWILDQHCDFALHGDDVDEVAERKSKTQRLASRFNVSLRCMEMRLRDLVFWRQMRRGR